MLELPTIKGIIERRILANYRISPEVLAGFLPKPFTPQIINGYAVGGICLIRLKNIRPVFSPFNFGFSSENAAHRFAVEWVHQGEKFNGVYVPRRDTNSYLTSLVGGRLFPGMQYYTKFNVKETDSNYQISLQSNDKVTNMNISGKESNQFSEASIFESLENASLFFKNGSLGYSPSKSNHFFEGMELNCTNWETQPLAVSHIESSFFSNQTNFPKGSIEFDCALLMKNIHHEWQNKKNLCC